MRQQLFAGGGALAHGATLRAVLIGFVWFHLACSSDSSSPDDAGGVGGTGATPGGSSGTSGNGGSGAGGTATAGTAGSAEGASGGTPGTAGGGAGAGGSGGASAGSAGQPPQGGAGASGAAGTAGSGGAVGGAGAGGANGGSAGGGTAGAGGSAGTGGGVGTGCGASAIFCEDFEALADGPAQKTSKWTPMGNTLSLDATHARGKRALHIKTQASGDAYIQLSSFSAPSNSFFGRIYLWATAFPNKPDYAHFTLVEAAGTGNGSLVRFVGGQYIGSQNGALWGVGSDGGPTGDWTSWKASAPAEAGKWLCMEWEAVAASGTIRVWIDGAAKTDLTVSANMHPNGGTFTFPTFNKMSVGWWLYQENATPTSYDFWIDDVAFSPTRVGCN